MRRTLFFLALLLLLLVVVFLTEKKQPALPVAIETKNSAFSPVFLFDEQQGQVLAIKIVENYLSLELERDDGGLWTVLQPKDAVFEQGVVEAAATQLHSLPVLAEDLSLPASELGLQEQAIQVNVSFSGGKISAFRVGNPTPSGDGYYIQLDDGRIYIVDFDSLDTFLKLFAYFELEK